MIRELEKLGLNESEAQVYIAVLELGEAGATRIAQKAKLKRTSVYGIIQSLQKHGLISATKKKGKNLYYADSPDKILDMIHEQEKVAEALLPELRSIANLIDNKPKIKFYEGIEALAEIYKDTLNYPGREYLNWISNIDFYKNFDVSFWRDFYIPTRIKNKIWVRIIAPDSPALKKFRSEDIKNLRQTRIDKEGGFIQSTVLLYGNKKVGIISTDELLGVVIESAKFYSTLKGLFEIQWKSLENQNR